MGRPIDIAISIQVGGVFASGSLDEQDFRERLIKVTLEANEAEELHGVTTDLPCVSHELVAWKGSSIVIAGVFNYWTAEDVAIFTKRLSVEFGNAMYVWWEDSSICCGAFIDGKDIAEVFKYG